MTNRPPKVGADSLLTLSHWSLRHPPQARNPSPENTPTLTYRLFTLICPSSPEPPSDLHPTVQPFPLILACPCFSPPGRSPSPLPPLPVPQYWFQPLQLASALDPLPNPSPLSPCQSWLLSPIFISVRSGRAVGAVSPAHIVGSVPWPCRQRVRVCRVEAV